MNFIYVVVSIFILQLGFAAPVESFKMAEGDLFGWDLLYKTIEKRIVRESDIVVALIHWYLIKQFNFRCIGIGDDKTLGCNEVGSELLPCGWNDCEKSYALRYVSNQKLYILLATKTEDTLIVNFLDVKTREVSNLAVNPQENVKALQGPLKVIVPGVSTFLDRIKKELVEPVYKGTKREVTTQTQAETSQTRNISSPLTDIPFGISPLSGYANPNRVDPLRDIGRGDLDPLGRGGSGMLFPQPGAGPRPFGGGEFGGPEGPGGIGPVPPRFPPPPPGARFDPFSPPDRNIRPNPNPDHFRPPFDDYFS